MHRSSAHTAVIAMAVIAVIATAPLVWSFATQLPSLGTAEEETTTSADTADK